MTGEEGERRRCGVVDRRGGAVKWREEEGKRGGEGERWRG